MNEEDKKAQQIENVIESNPEQSQEVLNTIAPDNPITEEANQITDGNPNNVEVNNQQVEKGLKDLSDIDELFNLIENEFKDVKPVEDVGGFLNNGRNNPLLESNEESVVPMQGEDKAVEQANNGIAEGELNVENPIESNTMESTNGQSQGDIDSFSFLSKVEQEEGPQVEKAQVEKAFQNAMKDLNISDPEAYTKIYNASVSSFELPAPVYELNSRGNRIEGLRDRIKQIAEDRTDNYTDEYNSILQDEVGPLIAEVYNREGKGKDGLTADDIYDRKMEEFTDNPAALVKWLDWKAKWTSHQAEHASFVTDLQDFYKKGYITDEDIKKAVNESAEKYREIEAKKKEIESLPEEKKEITTKALDLIGIAQSQNTLKQSIKSSVKSKGIDWDKVHIYEPGEDPYYKVADQDFDPRIEANNEYEYPEGEGASGVLTEKDEDFAGPDELPAQYEKYGDVDPYRQLPAIYEEKGLVGVEEYVDNYPHEVEWAIEEIDRKPGGEPLPEEEEEQITESESKPPHEVDLKYTGSNVGKNEPFESEETRNPGVSGSAGKPGLLGNLGRLSSGGSVSAGSPIKHDSPENNKGTSVNRAHGDVLPDPNNQHSVVAGSHEMPQIGKSMFGGLGMMKPLYRSDMRIRVGESHLPEGHERHTAPVQSSAPKGVGVSMPNISALTNAEELIKQLKFKHPGMPFEIRNGQIYLKGRRLKPEEINSLIN